MAWLVSADRSIAAGDPADPEPASPLRSAEARASEENARNYEQQVKDTRGSNHTAKREEREEI